MPVRREGIVDLTATGVTPTEEVPGLAAVRVYLQRLDEELDCFSLPGRVITELLAAMVEPTWKGGRGSWRDLVSDKL